MQKWAIDFIKWCDDNEIEVSRIERRLLELKVFEAKNKGLTSLHPSIVYLKRLRRIDLSNHVLKDLPTLPQNLITLILKNNIFSEIPQNIRKSKHLTNELENSKSLIFLQDLKILLRILTYSI